MALSSPKFVLATGYDSGAIPWAYHEVQRCEKPIDPAKPAWAMVKAG